MTKQTKNNLIILVAGMGMLLSTLDTGIINVALPFLQHQFHSTTSVAALSVVGYTTSLAVLILPFGYLSDQIGKLKVSLTGLLIFGFGSILCGLATNISGLIIFRIIQGIGAAALQATSAASNHHAYGSRPCLQGSGDTRNHDWLGSYSRTINWRFLFSFKCMAINFLDQCAFRNIRIDL